MKILVLGFIFSTSLCIIGCSSEEVSLVGVETTFLRTTIETVYTAVDWQEDQIIEREEVTTIDEEQVKRPFSLFVSEAVYPDLDGFGSLDNSAIPNILLQDLDNFFTTFPQSALSDFILKERTYLPFFLQRALYGFEIKSWLYGKPIIDTNQSVFEFPVRLYSEDLYVDILVFVAKKEEAFFIDQVQIGEIIRGKEF